MFQPGKVRGVRWTVHHVQIEGSVDEALVISTPVFQLLAGVKLRAVQASRVKVDFKAEGYARNAKETLLFYIAEGITRFSTLHESDTEMRVLYPAHGVVVPAGVHYKLEPITDLVVVIASDADEPSEDG